MVIGADGAWSRVRPLLSSTEPHYTGFTYVDFTVSHVSQCHAHLPNLIGPGTACMLDDQRGIIAQMNGNDSLRAYAVLKVPEAWLDSTDADEGGAFLAHISADTIDAFIARTSVAGMSRRWT